VQLITGAQLGEVICLRLDYGEDVLEAITRTARELDIQSGVVLSGIGTLYQAVMHMITTTTFPPVDQVVTLEGPLEVTSICGLIADYQPHLHLTISDTRGAYAGHLEPGCLTMYLCEIALARLQGVQLYRAPHPETGIKQLGTRPAD